LAKYFGSSEPSSGQFLTYRHSAVSECAHCGITYCLQTILILKSKLKCAHSLVAPCSYIKNWNENGSLETKHVANYVLMIIYTRCVRKNYFIILVPGTLSWNKFVAFMKEYIVWHEMIHGKFRQNNGMGISYTIRGGNRFQLQLGTQSCWAISIQIVSQISWQHIVAVVAVGTRTRK